MSEDVFQKYSAYYDLLYTDKNYPAEVEYITRTLKDTCPSARTLLEFGSGSGKHGRMLAAKGYDVFGVERSAGMVTAAHNTPLPERPAGANFACVQGDMQDFDAGRTFDAVLSLFHVVSYQTTNDDLVRTFENAARHLQPGGYFFFDVWHGPAVLALRPTTRVKRVENAEIRLFRLAESELDSNSGIVTVNYTMLAEDKNTAHFTTFQEQHRMRYLFPTEISLLAQQTGFTVERTEEFLTGNSASEQTWGVAYLLRRASSL